MIGTFDHSRMRAITSWPSRSGRPRSRITRSGLCGRALGDAVLAAHRLDHLVAIRVQADPQELADLRFVVDHQDARDGGRGHGGASASGSRSSSSPPSAIAGSGSHRKPEGDRRAAPAGPGQRLDPAAVGLDQAAADRQAEARPGRLLVARAHAVEHVEHGVARFGRDAGPLVAHPHAHLARRPAPPAISIRPPGRRVLGGVVENVDQHLLDEDRVDVEDRHARPGSAPRPSGRRATAPSASSARPTISRRSTHSRFGCSAP